ncbi:MAG TPA: O-antigen ligase family protein [Methylomirabilota bacterium]
MPLSRLLLVGVLLIVTVLILNHGLSSVRFEYALGLLFAAAVFVFVFVKAEAGLYLVLFSMLLSPEFSVGGGGLAESRALIVRLEDLLLVAIALSWFAKTAVNKELGLVAQTPLNRWILLYVLTTFMATLVGYVVGSVKTAAGFFYVLKYVEYFVVYYLTVNNLRDRPQAWRLVTTAFLTAAIVSVIGLAQIPGGERVSAPFEGETGEPNSLGGYLLFMMAVAAGVALESRRLRLRVIMAGLVGLMAVPFAFTLSRASYLGVLPTVAMLALLSSRRRLMMGVLAIMVVCAPLVLPSLVPTAVKKRVLYTFEPERGQTTVRLGRVAFDPATSERLVAMRNALAGWVQRPILGWGVTGFRFMDAQYARTLVETGIVGFAVFVGLLRAIFRSGIGSLHHLASPEDRGLVIGFLAGTVGLLFHAIGSNTFIIIRIMEPFWFFAGVVLALPALSEAPGEEPARQPAQAFGLPA